MQNKTQKLIYLTDDALKKLELLKNANCMNYSAIINYLIYKQKKVQLF